MKLKVNEIFYSIQGESSHAGRPCVFVRLTGCNLGCRYCDTVYAYNQGTDMTVSQVMDRVQSFGCRLVEITGGEPLLQEGTPLLTERLLSDGYDVLVETNGSINIDRVDRRCGRIMDIKCPSSGEHLRNDPSNIDRLTANDEVKFVIGNHQDFLYAIKMMGRLPTSIPHHHVLFSSIFADLPLDQLAKWILDAKIAARLQLQLHKFIWPDLDRGV